VKVGGVNLSSCAKNPHIRQKERATCMMQVALQIAIRQPQALVLAAQSHELKEEED